MRSSLNVVFALLILLLMTGLAHATELPEQTTNAASPSQEPYPGMVCGNADCSIRWSEELGLKSLEDIDQRLKENFEYPYHAYYVRNETDTKEYVICLGNCNKLIFYSQKGASPKMNNDMKVMMFHFAKCKAIQLLRSAISPLHNYFQDFKLNADALLDLSPRFGLTGNDASEAERTEAGHKGLSWKEFEPKILVESQEDNKIVVACDGYHVWLREYARGDFNQDGFQDILLSAQVEVDEGTYGYTELFFITKKVPSKLVQIVNIFY